ncbi:protoporphyrinogen oxidase [Corynebacterium sp. CCUG 69979]|uniref:protoporphyrinogen oxidase n=1 Tax=Corynebacterium sp. CCUG 69979 TaxID=2823890 RepID=UPI00210EA768|nr:protoporphyrinogen oxidase [Corynebacterium sp. CCUG 69979]MCQ4623987.1 protoporphyrinogen oxidase [Corynebacterium sp. CCUG 69979]
MNIAIIGAGLAGLTAAYELRHGRHDGRDDKVDVYEATDRIGGKLYTVAFEAGPTDMGAEAFMARRRDAVEFFESLGLGDSLVEPSGLRSLLWSGGAVRELPTGGVMGIPGRSDTVAHLVSADTAALIDAESDRPGFHWPTPDSDAGDLNVGTLVRERYGDEVADIIVSPLLGGVYSCTADDLGVRATIPQLAAEFDRLAAEHPERLVHLSTAVRNLEAQRAELPTGHGAVFNAFRDGYQELYETLAEQSGADIYIDAFISGIERADSSSDAAAPQYKLTGGEDTHYDHVILAVPAPTAALLLKRVAPEVAEELAKVKLANSAVVGMRFADGDGLPENSGILIADTADTADTAKPDVRAKAFTLSSKKWPHLAERGGALVRASFGRYGDNPDLAITASEDDLVDWALDDLQTITGFDGREAGLEEIYVQRWFGGLPRYDEGHVGVVRDVDKQLAQVPGISATGAWAGGVGVPAVIAHARDTARAVG